MELNSALLQWFLAELRRRFKADEFQVWEDFEKHIYYRITCPDVVLKFAVSGVELMHVQDIKALYESKLDELERQLA